MDYAKDELRSLLSGQWQNGMVPHMIYWKRPDTLKKKNVHGVNWGTDTNTSSITQPPMIAYAAERIYEKDGNSEFISQIFDRMHEYYNSVNGNGLGPKDFTWSGLVFDM